MLPNCHDHCGNCNINIFAGKKKNIHLASTSHRLLFLLFKVNFRVFSFKYLYRFEGVLLFFCFVLFWLVGFCFVWTNSALLFCLHFILTLLNIRSINIVIVLLILPYFVGLWSHIKALLILESFLMSSSHPVQYCHRRQLLTLPTHYPLYNKIL